LIYKRNLTEEVTRSSPKVSFGSAPIKADLIGKILLFKSFHTSQQLCQGNQSTNLHILSVTINQP